MKKYDSEEISELEQSIYNTCCDRYVARHIAEYLYWEGYRKTGQATEQKVTSKIYMSGVENMPEALEEKEAEEIQPICKDYLIIHCPCGYSIVVSRESYENGKYKDRCPACLIAPEGKKNAGDCEDGANR